jgi:hypothetical protein
MELLDVQAAFAFDPVGSGRPGRATGVSILGWVGGCPTPARGPLQVISGGTWTAIPIGRRLSLDIGLGGTRYITGITFEPADHPATPVSVAIHARCRRTGNWRFLRRCQLRRAHFRCPILPVQADALRLEFDPGEAGRGVAVGPVRIDMKRIQ